MAVLNRRVQKRPTLLLRIKYTVPYTLSGKVETEGRMMQGMGEKRRTAPLLLTDLSWTGGGEKKKKRKKLLYKKHLQCR